MVTKATRDVIDLQVRAIEDGILVVGDGNAANFAIDGTIIGSVTPDDGTFVNLTATNLTVTGTFDGSGSTVVGTWAATYSDVAEYYEADNDYEPGTVVKIGGDKEITSSAHLEDDVFGVISSEPAYVLNSGKEGLYLPVVMVGRIPVRVVGPITKGQRLVASDTPGVARAVNESERSCDTPIFGRSLVDDSEEGERLVECAFVTIR